MKIFLNRIMCTKIEMQKTLYELFERQIKETVKMAKLTGQYNERILDLPSNSEVRDRRVLTTLRGDELNCYIVTVRRGMSFEEAHRCGGTFWLSKKNYRGTRRILMAKEKIVDDYNMDDMWAKRRKKVVFEIYRPNFGKYPKIMTEQELSASYVHETNDKISEQYWQNHFESSKTSCAHRIFVDPTLMKAKCDEYCQTGKSILEYAILHGGTLFVWWKHMAKLRCDRLVRFTNKNGNTIVGVMMPLDLLKKLSNSRDITEMNFINLQD